MKIVVKLLIKIGNAKCSMSLFFIV